jgi:hypothetical protein
VPTPPDTSTPVAPPRGQVAATRGDARAARTIHEPPCGQGDITRKHPLYGEDVGGIRILAYGHVERNQSGDGLGPFQDATVPI